MLRLSAAAIPSKIPIGAPRKTPIPPRMRLGGHASARRLITVSPGAWNGTPKSPTDLQHQIAHYYRFQQFAKGMEIVKDPPFKPASGKPLSCRNAKTPTGRMYVLTLPTKELLSAPMPGDFRNLQERRHDAGAAPIIVDRHRYADL